MLQELFDLGADINVESGVEYESLDAMAVDAQELGCDAVINCTGLGAKKICNDMELIGGRGILLQFDRKSVVWREPVLRGGIAGKKDAVVLVDDAPWGSDTEPCYMIPRGNLLVVGGSYLEGDDTPNLLPEERDRLFRNAHHLGIDTTQSFPVGEWTGFRPFRPKVRCEEDQTRKGIRVIHNYGHGGSGWTVNVGAAKQVADILLGKSS
jgi:D-amino-acid oxidase